TNLLTFMFVVPRATPRSGSVICKYSQAGFREPITWRRSPSLRAIRTSSSPNGESSMSETDIISVGDPLPLIDNIAPADVYSVVLTWLSGARQGVVETVDLAPYVLTFKLFRPLRENRDLFETVHVAADGAAIAWGGNNEIDMPATAIERLAAE